MPSNIEKSPRSAERQRVENRLLRYLREVCPEASNASSRVQSALGLGLDEWLQNKGHAPARGRFFPAANEIRHICMVLFHDTSQMTVSSGPGFEEQADNAMKKLLEWWIKQSS